MIGDNGMLLQQNKLIRIVLFTGFIFIVLGLLVIFFLNSRLKILTYTTYPLNYLSGEKPEHNLLNSVNCNYDSKSVPLTYLTEKYMGYVNKDNANCLMNQAKEVYYISQSILVMRIDRTIDGNEKEFNYLIEMPGDELWQDIKDNNKNRFKIYESSGEDNKNRCSPNGKYCVNFKGEGGGCGPLAIIFPFCMPRDFDSTSVSLVNAKGKSIGWINVAHHAYFIEWSENSDYFLIWGRNSVVGSQQDVLKVYVPKD